MIEKPEGYKKRRKFKQTCASLTNRMKSRVGTNLVPNFLIEVTIRMCTSRLFIISTAQIMHQEVRLISFFHSRIKLKPDAICFKRRPTYQENHREGDFLRAACSFSLQSPIELPSDPNRALQKNDTDSKICHAYSMKELRDFQKLTILTSELLFVRRYRFGLLLHSWFFLLNLPVASSLIVSITQNIFGGVRSDFMNLCRYYRKIFHMRHPKIKTTDT